MVLRSEDKRFRFTPRRMHATFDLNAMVDDAVARSREGNIFARTIRSVRGTAIYEDLPADVHYSHASRRASSPTWRSPSTVSLRTHR